MEAHGDLSKNIEGSVGDLSVVSNKEGMWRDILKFNRSQDAIISLSVAIHGIPKRTEKYPGYDISFGKYLRVPY